MPIDPRSRLGRRRKFWFAACGVLLAYAAWAWYAGLAFSAGTRVEEMDWNGDGAVSTEEMLQSAYAVGVRTMQQGARTCRSFYWIGKGEKQPFRVSCRTEVGDGKKPKD
ncbi:EF-hand domain-containing protein [Luteimonas aquatica]|uniref:EF-hand domain-containing protein n=1 Tax=Luteimonas aquatica TaxID=450364 RepID=UPI001F5A3E21|nr:EF-hand domain-containing protein [Luteimonas aquatica]